MPLSTQAITIIITHLCALTLSAVITLPATLSPTLQMSHSPTNTTTPSNLTNIDLNYSFQSVPPPLLQSNQLNTTLPQAPPHRPLHPPRPPQPNHQSLHLRRLHPRPRNPHHPLPRQRSRASLARWFRRRPGSAQFGVGVRRCENRACAYEVADMGVSGICEEVGGDGVCFYGWGGGVEVGIGVFVGM